MGQVVYLDSNAFQSKGRGRGEHRVLPQCQYKHGAELPSFRNRTGSQQHLVSNSGVSPHLVSSTPELTFCGNTQSQQHLHY